MKTILKVMFLLCGIGFIPSIAKAQEKVIIDDEAPNGIVMVTIDKAGDEIVRIMNESQFRYIHDPKAPRLNRSMFFINLIYSYNLLFSCIFDTQ